MYSILVFPERLSSDNLLQTVFLIDLPKLSESSTNVVSKTSFYEDLVYFLKASTLHDNIITKLSSFDFSETARYAFVHTM